MTEIVLIDGAARRPYSLFVGPRAFPSRSGHDLKLCLLSVRDVSPAMFLAPAESRYEVHNQLPAFRLGVSREATAVPR